MRRSERGAALLTVLLLVSVMAVLSASALERLRLATRLAANAGAIDQARAYAVAAEGIALARITDLVEADPGRTTLAGGWNGRETRLPLPDGEATAVVRDGGNCFNLNSVVAGDVRQTEQSFAVRPIGVTQFTTLMRSVGVGGGEAARVADSLADWVDSDTTALPQGAEDNEYAARAQPHRAANTLLADASELRAVAGVTPDIYQRLRPYICALPVTDLSPINVNTLLPEQAPLIAMLLSDPAQIDAARAVIAARPASGWEGTPAFWNDASRAGLQAGQEAQGQVGVRTSWFTLALKVRVGESELDEAALIDATLTPAKLVRRSWGEGA